MTRARSAEKTDIPWTGIALGLDVFVTAAIQNILPSLTVPHGER